VSQTPPETPSNRHEPPLRCASPALPSLIRRRAGIQPWRRLSTQSVSDAARDAKQPPPTAPALCIARFNVADPQQSWDSAVAEIIRDSETENGRCWGVLSTWVGVLEHDGV